MHGSGRSRGIGRLLLAAIVAAILVAGRLAIPGSDVAALSKWTGGLDLYRSGVFTTQKTWLWCTAADVQMMRNIKYHQVDHTKAGQQRYFTYMRAHNRYAIPVSDGVDPGGWLAGLRHDVDPRYRLYANTSFTAALKTAVTNLRKTNLPVALAVQHGNHGWMLTGFTATADPARTSAFTVTSVRVVGPLWGLQNRSYGYDMKPDTRLTPSQLKSFFTPWHYARIRMVWEGKWVSFQPLATATTTASTSTASTSKATTNVKVAAPVVATPLVTPTLTRSATPDATPTVASPDAVAEDPSGSPSGDGLAVADPPVASPVATPADASDSDTSRSAAAASAGLILIGLVVAMVVGGAILYRRAGPR